MSSRTADKFMLRLPDDLRQRIKVAAAQNRRSMNLEVVIHLERALGSAPEATGAEFGDTTPAASSNTAALPGGDVTTHGR